VRFLIDAMFHPLVADQLSARGHDAVSPISLGTPRMLDEAVIDLAISDSRIIVTENMADFASVTRCTVLFALKDWWPREALAQRLTAALERWATANPEPGKYARWLEAEFR
jgi:hypothetical protein